MSRYKTTYNKTTKLYQVIGEGASSMPCTSIREAKESWKIIKALNAAVFAVKDGELIMNVDLKGR